MALPDKQSGDSLEASHVNELSRAAGIVLGQGARSYQHSGAPGQGSGLKPFTQRVVIITCCHDGSFDNLLYGCKLRYFDTDDNTWRTDDDANEFDLDASSLRVEGDSGGGSRLAIGDVLNAYWDPQRDMWIPIVIGTTTSTTSTTPNPQIGSDIITTGCTGDCKWIWSASQNQWNQDTDNCVVATTTSTTSTTTTTTTCVPCVRPTTTTTTTTTEAGATTTSTTSTTTTTLAPASCTCTYPVFCGLATGDCTFTSCSQFVSRSRPPDCAPTTTTTTTTCDCNTSTTSTTTNNPLSGCTSGCDWTCDVGGWVQRTDGCTGDCSCLPPSPSDCIACDSAHTPCITPPEIPIPDPFCGGTCEFRWSIIAQRWVRVRFDCFSIGAIGGDCLCITPSFPGALCGVGITVPCGLQPIPTTTSTTTTTNSPCFQCYTTTTTSTTTVTPSCDTGSCIHKWDGSSWSVVEDECFPCLCQDPPVNGQETCEIFYTRCVDPTATTTTTSAGTTTTTTTAPPSCQSSCTWVCVQISRGVFDWRLLHDCAAGDLSADCDCPHPVGRYDPNDPRGPGNQVGCGSVGVPSRTFLCDKVTGACCSGVSGLCTDGFIQAQCDNVPSGTFFQGQYCSDIGPCTTTTTTTTVAPGCTGNCTWVCDGENWNVTADSCSAPCDTCNEDEPAGDCDETQIGKTTVQPCVLLPP